MSLAIENTRPFINKMGKKLSDKEYINASLSTIEKYEKQHNKPAPVSPRFIQWLKDAKQQLGMGVSSKEFKEKTIQKMVDNYDIIINNTNKLNKKLKKRGN